MWLRLTLWKHGLRRITGVANIVVGVLLGLLGIVASIALAAALAKMASVAAQSGDGEVLLVTFNIAFYCIAFFAIIVPCLIGMGQARLPASRLACFPIPHRSLYVLDLASSAAAGTRLFWYPAMITTMLYGVVLPSVDLVPGLTIGVLLSVLMIAWCHALQGMLQLVMRRRTVKELVIVGAFTVLMTASLLPALVDSGVLGFAKRPVYFDILLEALLPVMRALPPSRAAEGIAGLYSGAWGAPWAAIGWLAVWAASGIAVGSFAFSKALFESGSGRVPMRRRRSAGTARNARFASRMQPLGWLPNDVAAVAVKEFRYVTRSTPGKLVLIIAPLFVVMISLAVGRLMFAKKVLFGIDPADYAFFGVLLYGSLVSANFLVNAFAWEGAGLKAYLVNPLPARRLILGKNAGVAIFQTIVLAECLVVWSVIKGPPSFATLLCGVLVFAIGVLMLAIPGNFTSIAYPVKRSISAVANSASQVGTLVTFGATAVAAGMIGGLLILGLTIGGAPAQIALLAILAAALATTYALLLESAADLFEDRTEGLLEAVGGPDGHEK